MGASTDPNARRRNVQVTKVILIFHVVKNFDQILNGLKIVLFGFFKRLTPKETNESDWNTIKSHLFSKNILKFL